MQVYTEEIEKVLELPYHQLPNLWHSGQERYFICVGGLN